MTNKKISHTLKEIATLLEIKGVSYKPAAYRKAALSLEKLPESISKVYEAESVKGIEQIPGVGKSIAKKIEEYLKKGKIKYLESLREETAIRQIVTHYFNTKGVNLSQLKDNAKKKKIVYSRYTKPAKNILELCGSVDEAKKAIDKVAAWASTRDLDYAIETVFKKWPELDRLKPKEKKKVPYFRGDPMVWSESRKKWYVVDKGGAWLEFAGKEEEIEWKIEKNKKYENNICQ